MSSEDDQQPTSSRKSQRTTRTQKRLPKIDEEVEAKSSLKKPVVEQKKRKKYQLDTDSEGKIFKLLKKPLDLYYF